MSQGKCILSAMVAGAMVMTSVVIAGCAVRVPSSEMSAMSLAGEQATDDAAGNKPPLPTLSRRTKLTD